jgi:hypothetical protein
MIKGIRYYLKLLQHRRILREAKITPEDIFLVSFPKSGNTWMRFILANALYPQEQIDLRRIQSLLPTMHRSSAKEMRTLPSPRYIKTHSAFFSLYPRAVYLCRDYRDVVVSAFFHAKNRGLANGSISDFIRSGLLNSFGPWHWHVSSALEQQEKFPEKVLFLRYEDLRKDPAKKIAEVLEFCRINTSISAGEIAERTSFSKLRSTEEKGGSRSMDASGNFFFRKGESGDWKNHLSAADEEFLLSDPRTRAVMKRLGYL